MSLPNEDAIHAEINGAIETLRLAQREVRQGNHDNARHDLKRAVSKALQAFYLAGGAA